MPSKQGFGAGAGYLAGAEAVTLARAARLHLDYLFNNSLPLTKLTNHSSEWKGGVRLWNICTLKIFFFNSLNLSLLMKFVLESNTHKEKYAEICLPISLTLTT